MHKTEWKYVVLLNVETYNEQFPNYYQRLTLSNWQKIKYYNIKKGVSTCLTIHTFIQQPWFPNLNMISIECSWYEFVCLKNDFLRLLGVSLLKYIKLYQSFCTKYSSFRIILAYTKCTVKTKVQLYVEFSEKSTYSCLRMWQLWKNMFHYVNCLEHPSPTGH